MTAPSRSSRSVASALVVLVVGSLFLAPARATAQALATAPPVTTVASPEAFFGFRMGTDGKLAGWAAIEKYFNETDTASDRVSLVEIGPTTEGRRLIGAIVSAPENIARLGAIQAANRRLADPRTVSDDEAAKLVADHRVIVAIGCSIHASEIGATQTANELLYELATTDDPQTLAVLRDVVIILIPSLNPDGHELVVDWFNRQQGTAFEAAPMPWLYHKYAGHDINRDAFMLNLAENRSIARFFYKEWHPQVFLTMHQMGSTGPRFFLPPNYDPIDPNYDPIIWRTAGLLGHAMALQMERDGHQGVINSAMFDYYWPGYEDSAPLGHNTVCLLTEVASVALANPLTVQASELTGTPRGLPDYRTQINFPNPWPGGTWRLRDIVDYELSAVRGLLLAASRYRDELVRNFYVMGQRAIEQGERGGPFAFVVAPNQYDQQSTASLTNLLIDGGVEVQRSLEPFRVADNVYPAGTDVIFMAQPFRAYAKTLLERQVYPVRRLSPNAPPERPYDVTGWTLPLQMGVSVETIQQYFEPPPSVRLDHATMPPAQLWGDPRPSYYLVDARGNAGATAINRLTRANVAVSWTTAPIEAAGYTYQPGSLVVTHSRESRSALEGIARELGLRATGLRGRVPDSRRELSRPRVALYKPWVSNIDEGWTRWLLEQYEFAFESLTDQVARQGNLRSRYDVIILPDDQPDRLTNGHRPGSVPAEYAGGLGDEGIAALMRFVESGGTLVCLDSSCGLALQAFGLPLREVAQSAGPDRVFVPGSLVGLDLSVTEPLAFGMPAQTSAFFAFSAAFDSATPTPTNGANGGQIGPGVKSVARYASRDLLQSGWLEGESLVAGRTAVAEATVGQGRVVLIGFRAQHRAQSAATFRLLFNAIFTHPAAATQTNK